MKKFEMHCHSTYSDGVNTPTQIAKELKKKGFQGFALTDHDSVSGNKEAEKAAKERKLEFIPGLEISTKEGHVLAYGIKKLVPKNLSVKKTIELVHAQNALAVAPHPNDFSRCGLSNKTIKENDFDAIEVYNSKSFFNSSAVKLAKKLGLPMTAGSDAHTLFELGTSYVEFEGSWKNIKNYKVFGGFNWKGVWSRFYRRFVLFNFKNFP